MNQTPTTNTINTYTCTVCDERIVTQDMDNGATPSSIICPVCNAEMESAYYRCDQKLEPGYFWFKPNQQQIKPQVKWELKWADLKKEIKLKQALQIQQEHLDKGGLVLAPSKQIIKEWGTKKHKHY